MQVPYLVSGKGLINFVVVIPHLSAGKEKEKSVVYMKNIKKTNMYYNQIKA